MGRKKIVAGNWKMNTSHESAIAIVESILQQSFTQDVEKIIIPPYPFLSDIHQQIKNVAGFKLAAQNCSEFAQGAYTGEVSASMLKSVGCEYVLVGHSERRHYHLENTEQLKLKIEQALLHDLKIIFCFGEKLEERKSSQHFETVRQQLNEVLSTFPIEHIHQLILAYEPVWAIGTGETASPEQAQEMHAFIRVQVASIFSKEAAQNLSILYGGSCNAQNAKQLFACKDVDGGLIGGASLKSEDFCTIINSF